MIGRPATAPAPPAGPTELRLRAAAPLPPLRPVADFVGLPTGAESLSPASRQAIVGGGALGWAAAAVAGGALLARGAAGLITWPAVLVLLTVLVGLPGALAARRVLALLLADQPAVSHLRPVTPVTVLVPAADAAPTTATLVSLAHQDYDGPVRVVTAATQDPRLTQVAALAARELGLAVDVVPPGPPGRADWRNTVLARLATPLVVSLAPGASLHPSALRLLVARLGSCPAGTVGVAAHVLVRTPRRTTGAEALARAWTFELDASQRAEALLSGPLVADGTCTLLRTDALQAVNGWPSVEPRAAAVTWRCLERGWTTTSEPQALAFATAPVTSATAGRTRARAAGVVRRAARASGGPPRLAPRASRAAARLDRARPALDAACSLAWLVALTLAGLGRLGLVLAPLVLVVPVSLAGLALERRRHRELLDEAGLALAHPPHRWRAALWTVDPFQAGLGVWGQLTRSRP